MKFDFTLKLFGNVLTSLIKKDVQDKVKLKEIKTEYKNILERASDIGNKNNLIFSYTLAAYFIAMNRKTGLTPEENIAIMDKAIRSSNMIRPLLGDAKSYFDPKRLEDRKAWSKKTHEKLYKNDWVVDVLDKDENEGYEFGLDYTECGVCKLCKDEGCPELAKYLCKLDFMLVEIIGIKLKRTMTLAEGCPKCDFRFYKS